MSARNSYNVGSVTEEPKQSEEKGEDKPEQQSEITNSTEENQTSKEQKNEEEEEISHNLHAFSKK